MVGNRSVLGPLSDGKPWFPIGHRHSKRGARKYYLHSPQPESGRCGLEVILLDWKIRENPNFKKEKGCAGTELKIGIPGPYIVLGARLPNGAASHGVRNFSSGAV